MAARIPTPAEIGATIRAARKAAGLRQDELAGAAGVGLRFVVDLERGKPTAQVGKMLQVLAALGCTLDITPPAPRGERFASVWDAIEDIPAQAENMRLGSALMMALKDYIKREGLSQAEAARLFGVGQPRVSDLMRGKIDLFGLDTLVKMVAAAGMHVELRVAKAA